MTNLTDRLPNLAAYGIEGSLRDFDVVTPMRWGDMDAMGHLNNTLYFRLMEEARIRWLYALGVMFEGPSACGPILAHIRCDFVKPAVYPCHTRVQHRLTRIGRSSMEHAISIVDDADHAVVYSKAQSVIVWMDYASGRSEPWPEAMLGLLQG